MMWRSFCVFAWLVNVADALNECATMIATGLTPKGLVWLTIRCLVAIVAMMLALQPKEN